MSTKTDSHKRYKITDFNCFGICYFIYFRQEREKMDFHA